MLNITTPANADAAAGYYGKSVSELESAGTWHGHGAAMLGLEGPVDLADFRNLVRGKTPEGEKLAQRLREDRRPLYDFCFSAPKSVAIIHQVAGDARIAEALRGAVAATMELVEERMETRVRRGLGYEHAETGNAIWTDFYHKLSRPVNGVPDPGDHIHATLMSATRHKGKWWAPEMSDIVASSGFLRAYFHNDLALRLRDLGYSTRRTATAFEIDGVPDAAIRKFSRRKEQIDRTARIKAPKARAAIAALTREKKRDMLSPKKLHAEWMQRLTPAEAKALKHTLQEAIHGAEEASGKRTLQSALASFKRAFRDRPREEIARDHLGETLDRMLTRMSAVPERTLLTEALKAGVGETTLPALRRELDAAKVLRATIDGVPYVSTHEAMRKEKEILDFAEEGGITIRRLKAGEEHGFAVRDPGLDQLHRLIQSSDSPIHLVGPLRDYRKSERGKPLVFLEDLGGLPTGQARPGQQLFEKAMRVGKAVRAKVKRHLDRVRRIKAQEHSHDVERQRAVTRQPEPGLGR